MQKSSWAITKSLLKSLQLTFVEHIHHVFVIKPRSFWQKRKVGVNLSMHKAKYNFPVSEFTSFTHSLCPYPHSHPTSSHPHTLTPHILTHSHPHTHTLTCSHTHRLCYWTTVVVYFNTYQPLKFTRIWEDH